MLSTVRKNNIDLKNRTHNIILQNTVINVSISNIVTTKTNKLVLSHPNCYSRVASNTVKYGNSLCSHTYC